MSICRCGKEIYQETKVHTLVPQETTFYLELNCGCYHTEPLLNQIQKLKEVIDIQKKTIRFYGNSDLWKHMIDPFTPMMIINLKNPDSNKHEVLNLYIGGKLARETEEQVNKIMEDLGL